MVKRCKVGQDLYADYLSAKKMTSRATILAWRKYEEHRDACAVCRAGDGGHTRPLKVITVVKEKG
jgi:hypothetical protein